MNCSRIGCKHQASAYPVLNFASLAMPDGDRASFRFPLPVCREHAIPDPKLYVSDEGWAQIVRQFAAQGYAEPDRSSIRVEFEVMQ